MILEPAEIKDTELWWLPPMRRSGFIIYWLVIILFLSGFISLFFIQVDITARAGGIIRPVNERTDIKSPVPGLIDTIYFKEGEQVVKNSLILTIRDPALVEKQRQNEADISRYQDYIQDLERLVSAGSITTNRVHLLHSPLYKQEALRFISRAAEHAVILSKARYETELNEYLARDKVISPKEFYDIRIQERKAVSAYETFRLEQMAEWQAGFIKYTTELKKCIMVQEELRQLCLAEQIRAPVAGSLLELNGRYPGNSIQVGELICSISPGGDLIGECFVASNDIGMIRKGQAVRLLIDAFNYNYFGAVTGSIYFIDHDFILLDKKPVFKVKCRLNERMLKLSNGYTGEIRKGMGFQARFVTCKRSLWQLLYDGLDDWLNPAGQQVLKNL
jgi:membrane fusion protein, peptide pheromone/bacteriocin exporter